MKPISLRVRGGILGELILEHKSNRFHIQVVAGTPKGGFHA